MADVLQLQAVVTASDDQYQRVMAGAIDVSRQFTAAMQTATGAMEKMAADMTAANEELSNSFKKLQQDSAAASQGFIDRLYSVRGAVSQLSTVMIGMGAAGAAALGLSTKAAMTFQQQMELLHTQAGATQAQVDMMSKSALAMAEAVGTGPVDLSKGLFHVVSLLNSMGVPAAKQMDVLKVSAEGAKVGIADMEETTNALGGAMASGIKGVGDASQTMGVLNAIIGAGNLRMNDLNAALSTGLLAKARSFGLSIQDVGAGLSVLTDNTMKAQPAAQRYGMALSLMGSASEAADKQLHKIGFSSKAIATDFRKPDGLLVAIEDLKAHLDESKLSIVDQGQVIDRAFGGGRSSSAIKIWLQQLDRLESKYPQITRTQGDFAKSWQATQETAAFQTSKFTASLQVLEVEAGTHLLPQLTHVVDAMTRWVDAFNNLSGPQQNAIVVTAEVATGVLLLGGAIGKVTEFALTMRDAWITLTGAETAAEAATAGAATATEGAGLAISGLLGPIGLVVAAIGGLALAWANDWGHIREVTYSTVDDIQNKINGSSIAKWINHALGDGGKGMTAAQLSGADLSPGMAGMSRVGPGKLPRGVGYDQIAIAARAHGLDERAMAAIAMHESGMDPHNVGDHGTSFGLFQLHRGGALGSYSPAQAFDPQFNADVAAQGMADAGAAGLTGRAAIARMVRGFERPKNPDAEIADAMNYYYHGFIRSQGSSGSQRPPGFSPSPYENGGDSDAVKRATQEAVNAIYTATHAKLQNEIYEAGQQKQKDLAAGVPAATANQRYAVTVAKARKDAADELNRKDLENEHKYLHDINEALKKRHEELMKQADLSAQATAAMQQQVLQAEAANAEGDPLKEYAAARHQIMASTPAGTPPGFNGPYSPGFYALRQAQLGALNRQTQGSLLGQWQNALQQRLQATGALDVMTPGGSPAGEQAYLSAIPAPAMPITPRMTAANPVGGMEQYIGRNVRGDNALAHHEYAYQQQVQQQIQSTPQYDYILSKLTQQAQDKAAATGDEDQLPFQTSSIRQAATQIAASFQGKSISDLMKWGETPDKAHQFTVLMQNTAQSMENVFESSFEGLFQHGAKGFFQNFLSGFSQMLEQMAAKWLAAQALIGLGGLIGGSAGGIFSNLGGNILDSMGLPGMASGGPVDAGQSYLIGENGPEILSMGGPGVITPNRSIGGYSQTVHNHFNVSTPDAGSFRRSGSQIATEYARTMSRQASRNR